MSAGIEGEEPFFVVDYLDEIERAATQSIIECEGYAEPGSAIPISQLTKLTAEYFSSYKDSDEESSDRMACAKAWQSYIDDPNSSNGPGLIIEQSALTDIVQKLRESRRATELVDIQDLETPKWGGLSKWNHGESFGLQTRWSIFMPDSYSAEDWQNLMGKDVNNYLHGFRQREIVGHMAAMMSWPKGAETFMRVVGELHDVGECKAAGSPNGDVALDHKSSLQENEEIELLYEILSKQEPFSSIDEETIRAVVDTLKDTHKKKPETKAGLLFDSSEKLGYLFTALTTANFIMHPDTSPNGRREHLRELDDASFERLKTLPMDVFGRSLPFLFERHFSDEASNLPELDNYVNKLFESFGSRIKEIFNYFGTEERIESYRKHKHLAAFTGAHGEAIPNMTHSMAEAKADTRVDSFLHAKALFEKHYTPAG